MPYDRKRPQPLNYNGEPLNYGRQYVTSGRIKKCETHSMLIKVWPNGEDLKGPRRVLLTPRVKPFTLPNVVAHVNEILKEDCLGTVERLYFLTGVQVSDVDQIAHNGQYVACKRAEKFKRTRYTEHGTKNLSTSPRLQRKLLAPLYPRSTNTLSQSSPEQSNPSTQSSITSNSNRRRPPPYEDDRTYPVKPAYRTPSSERNNTFDLDKDQGGMFKAKQTNRNTHGARPVQDSRETKMEVPAEVLGFGHSNGYSNYPNLRSRQTPQTVHRKPDTQREHSPEKGKDVYGNTKKHKEPRQPAEPRHFKQFSTGNRQEDEDNAATKIQAALRGHEVREEMKSPQKAKASSEIKPHNYDDKLEEYDSAAEKIQAAYRGHQTRQEGKPDKHPAVPKKTTQPTSGNRLEDQENAAAKIQAAYRGHQTRKELKSPKSPETRKPSEKRPPVSDDRLKEQDAAAVKIQAAYRGHLARTSNNQVHPAKSEDADEKNRAATKIQANYRGYNHRKSVASQSQHAAAEKIQAGYRGYQTRKELGSLTTMTQKDEAASKIQASYRGYQTRKRSSVKNEAATKIQSGYRGHLTRKNLGSGKVKSARDVAKDAEKEAAASKIQAGFRGYMARKEISSKDQRSRGQDSSDELAREDDAALTIQSHYRGYRARKEFANRRTEAVNFHHAF
ncbi:hypothetical protein BsWGS_14230 [Bradybaena similaris]